MLGSLGHAALFRRAELLPIEPDADTPRACPVFPWRMRGLHVDRWPSENQPNGVQVGRLGKASQAGVILLLGGRPNFGLGGRLGRDDGGVHAAARAARRAPTSTGPCVRRFTCRIVRR